MEDFFNYASNNTDTTDKNQGKNQNLVNLLNMLATKYDGKSENEILSAILVEAERSRKAGTLSDQDIDNFASFLAPMLDGFKRKKLYDICNKLKSKKIK